MMARFKKDFLLGAATAAHQVEGNNTGSDNWAQEQMKHSSFTEPSGDACDHYSRYREDIRLMAKACLNWLRKTCQSTIRKSLPLLFHPARSAEMKLSC